MIKTSDRPIPDVSSLSFVVLLREVGECRRVHDVRDGVSNAVPEPEKVAPTAKLAFSGTRPTHAINRRDRTIDEPHDLAEGDLISPFDQPSDSPTLWTNPPPLRRSEITSRNRIGMHSRSAIFNAAAPADRASPMHKPR